MSLIPQKRPLEDDGLATHQNTLLKALEGGAITTVEAIQNLDAQNAITRDRSPLRLDADTVDVAIHYGVLVLLGVSSDVKESLVRGRLLAEAAKSQLIAQTRYLTPRAALGRPRLDGSSSSTSEPYKLRPIIYGIFHVDGAGLPPRGTEYENIVSAVRKYLAVGDLPKEDDRRLEITSIVDAVDNAVEQGKKAWQRDIADGHNSRPGGRRYLHNKTSLANAQQWCEIVEEKLAAMEDKNEHLTWCPSDVGYTHDPETRKESHKKHTGSNILMNLVELVADYCYPGKYSMHWSILCECYQLQQVRIGEHIMSVLASSYLHWGGFNASCAGYSNASAQHLPTWVWEQLEAFAWDGPHLQSAMQRESDIHDAQREEREGLREELERLRQQEKELDEKLRSQQAEKEELTKRWIEKQEKNIRILEALRTLMEWIDKHEAAMDEIAQYSQSMGVD